MLTTLAARWVSLTHGAHREPGKSLSLLTKPRVRACIDRNTSPLLKNAYPQASQPSLAPVISSRCPTLGNPKISRAQQNRLRIASEISKYGAPTITPYNRYFLSRRVCIAMENSSRLKYSEYVRSGRPYTNLSQDSLDRTREEYREKIERDEKELAAVISRLLRNKQILKQADKKAKRKTEHLLEEVERSGDLEGPTKDYPTAAALISASPTIQGSLNLIDSSLDFSSGIPGEPSGNISSSCMVPTCFPTPRTPST